MAYSAEVVRRARQKLAGAKADRESQNRARLQSVYDRLPRVREIDLLLRKNMVQAAQEAFTSGAQARMEQVKKENSLLQQERRALIEQNLSAEYLELPPVCDICGGAGYVGSTMCSCLRELCRREQEKDISLLSQSSACFADFRTDLYSDRPDSKYGASPRRIMEQNLRICRKFAAPFVGGNLLFVGGTGLGKTFLSACIAREVTAGGYCVTYESAPHLFSALEKNRFSPDEESRLRCKSYTDCDLLIIDDLGTELPGNFVTAALYTVVNDRLLGGKSTIISTNLNTDEIERRYSVQIASRLRGEYRMLTFVGDDIRVLRNGE